MMEAVGAICVTIAVCLVLADKRNEFIPWFLAFGFVAFGTAAALAHDHEHPELDQWYASLMQPDNPQIGCCGKNDSYFCSEGSRGQQVTCIINDDRDDAELKRVPVPNGTVIEIPRHKINRDPNPTGRAVVFLSSTGHVWCFVGISGS